MNYKSRFIRLFLIGSILLQLVFSLIRWKALLIDPNLDSIDFVSFYTAGRIARTGDYTHLYDLQTQHEIQNKLFPADTIAFGVYPFEHPPYLAPLLSIITGDSYVKAYMVWTVLLVCVLVSCFLIIYKFLLSSGLDRISATLLAGNSIVFYPILLSVLKGQDTAFILLGLLFWMFGLLQGKELRSGFGLALSTLSPPVAGALVLPTLSSKRRAGAWFCLAFSLLAIFSLALVGIRGGIDYLHVLSISSQGQGYALNPSKMFNFLGLMLRSFPSLNLDIIHLLTWCVVILSISISVWLWWGKRSQLIAEHIGLVVILAVFSSPHLHAHSLSFLLLPLIGLSVYLWNRNNRSARVAAVMLIPICSLVMESSNIVGEAGLYVFTYFLMAALAGWFIYFMIKNSKTVPQPGSEPLSVKSA